MKNVLYTAIILLFAASAALAQQQNSFAVWPNPNVKSFPAANIDNALYGHITNTSNTTLNLRWTRTEVLYYPNMLTQVCDCNLCYDPMFGTMPFSMEPGDTCALDVHFLNYSGSFTSGIVFLKIQNEDVAADSLTVAYYFNTNVSTQNPLPEASVSLFPNPVLDHFTLDRAETVAAVRIYNTAGREVARYAAAPGQVYPLVGVPAGTYAVALEDSRGRVFQLVMVEKQ